jgi:DNA-directed RNA polymerase specialized sigma subunit
MIQPEFNKQQQLDDTINRNFGLIVSQAVFFRPRNKQELDEYIQIGSLAMLRGIKSFDATKGKFSTFICTCIKNALKTHVNKNKNKDSHIVIKVK